MNIAVGCTMLERHVQPAVRVAGGIRGRSSWSVEQYAEVGGTILHVSQVADEVAVELAVDLQSHLHRTDRTDGGTDAPSLPETGRIPVRN